MASVLPSHEASVEAIIYQGSLTSCIQRASLRELKPIRDGSFYASASTARDFGGAVFPMLEKSHSNLHNSAPTLSDCPRNEHVNLDFHTPT